jgi:hypothetical protein
VRRTCGGRPSRYEMRSKSHRPKCSHVDFRDGLRSNSTNCRNILSITMYVLQITANGLELICASLLDSPVISRTTVGTVTSSACSFFDRCSGRGSRHCPVSPPCLLRVVTSRVYVMVDGDPGRGARVGQLGDSPAQVVVCHQGRSEPPDRDSHVPVGRVAGGGERVAPVRREEL